AEKRAAWGQSVDRGDARGGDGGWSCARHCDSGTEANTVRAMGGQRQRGVAIGPDHLAIGQPGVGVAEFFGPDDVVDVAHM
ncbi:MAG: hypothetical protein ACI91O_000377, partial [Candidatus Poriferisodalaceae bacterium]